MADDPELVARIDAVIDAFFSSGTGKQLLEIMLEMGRAETTGERQRLNEVFRLIGESELRHN